MHILVNCCSTVHELLPLCKLFVSDRNEWAKYPLQEETGFTIKGASRDHAASGLGTLEKAPLPFPFLQREFLLLWGRLNSVSTCYDSPETIPEILRRWSYRCKPQTQRLPQNATRSVAVTRGLLTDIVNWEYITQILISTAYLLLRNYLLAEHLLGISPNFLSSSKPALTAWHSGTGKISWYKTISLCLHMDNCIRSPLTFWPSGIARLLHILY